MGFKFTQFFKLILINRHQGNQKTSKERGIDFTEDGAP